MSCRLHHACPHVVPDGPASGARAFGLLDAAKRPAEEVLESLRSGPRGLSVTEAARRLSEVGPNALLSHGARPLAVLVRQLRNPLLILLAAAALTSVFVGERVDAVIILAIVGLSAGLGFFNEYRSERAVEALHSQLRHTALAWRDGAAVAVDVTELVPGDVVQLSVGDVVPADVRLLRADGLECDEAVLTGESLPADKQVEAVSAPDSPLDLASCAFMGTVVREGAGLGVVVQTGSRTAFGTIALRLGDRQPQTAFQRGLRDFSLLLVRVTAVLAGTILLVNLALGRPLLEALLFALAIAVGLTPQLLPAIVTVSLSTGAKRLAARKVVVKRLVSIEDLGNIEVLFTDKTGTLTEGRIAFAAALDPTGRRSDAVLRAGLRCTDAVLADGEVVGGNQLDRALWEAPGAHELAAGAARRIAARPFDHQRRLASVLLDEDGHREVVVKGAPELVLERCRGVDDAARATLAREFAAGSRVVAVATRRADDGAETLAAEDEHDLRLAGFLTFDDRPKADAAEALERLSRLEVDVKLVTGDNGRARDPGGAAGAGRAPLHPRGADRVDGVGRADTDVLTLSDVVPERAGCYDAWFATPIGRATETAEAAALLRLTAPRRGEHVLDAGCSTGLYERRGADRGVIVASVDRDPGDARRRALSHKPRAEAAACKLVMPSVILAV